MKKLLSVLCLLGAVSVQAEMKNLPTPIYVPRNFGNAGSAPAFSTTLIDQQFEKIGFISMLSSTETVSKIAFLTNTLTTGDVLEWHIETVDRTNGIPDGNLYCTNSSGTVNVTTALTWTISNAATTDCVVKGNELFAVVLQSTGSLYNGLISGRMLAGVNFSLQVSSTSTGQSWTRGVGWDYFGALRPDGSYIQIPGVSPISAITTTPFSKATNPNTRGALFNFPFKVKVTGAFMRAIVASTSDAEIKLFSSTPTTVMAVTYSTANVSGGGAATGLFVVPFPTPIILEANTNYRLVVMSNGGGNVSLYDYTTPSAAADLAYEMGSSWILTTANNPTKESDWTNTPLRHPDMGLIISAIDTNQSNGGVSVGY